MIPAYFKIEILAKRVSMILLGAKGLSRLIHCNKFELHIREVLLNQPI